MKKMLISVIVPVYNVEKYLNDCVNSLINQSFENYEILLIDDGSTDNSSKICKDLSKNNSKVKYFSKKNGGLSDARNFGVGKSEGEYVTFVDSDDYVDYYFLEKLYNGVKDNKALISMCFYKKVPEKTLLFERSNFNKFEIKFVENDYLFNNLLTSNKSTPYETGTCKLIKKELFNDLIFPVGILHEDTATTYKLFNKSKYVSIIDEELYFYRQREGSITHVFNLKRLSLINILLDRQLFFNNLSYNLSIKHFIFMFNRFVRLRYEAKDLKEAYIIIDNAIVDLLNNEVFFKLPFVKKILFYIFAKCSFISNIFIFLKDFIKNR